ncbi:MAG: hypothetical protein UV63_C0008G0015 [Microgenomates group bacterium GW2011_GWC1_43_11]|uniref:Uncharacterized protein n=2 Tax=Candidatus Gottesmaniibacteriota TaxID=1752720 RepID=A0A0G1KYS7_9BACT|nr:MAG: hypothetical protein UV63_C0008G0015 [Microgenomates group bacterium GW2011_GWC1_43_11]KKT39045.1 MAG: hypothetical protein UW22_C0002G0021 [Candidatus Gottesmanbacteria bacterium GW2011_GWB1_44_11c]KKT61507.1 MAG: hypothetical protein UW52_C0002G0021 [Candidatus Gottesmanbacteria bacterium GW2011_GWA1_44_24b]
MEISPIVNEVLKVFEATKPISKSGHKFSVSRTVSTFAVLYEKARNAVEFRAEHLVRRAAIERILKRRIALESDPKIITENLMLELIWAKYIDSSLIDDTDIHAVAEIITKYLYLKQTVFGPSSPKYQGISWDTVMGIASAEIDETILPAAKREALVNFVYQSIRGKIQLPSVDTNLLNILTYICVERSYAQSDNALIMYHLLKMFDPSWTKRSWKDIAPTVQSFITSIQTIQQQLDSPLIAPMGRYLRKQLPPFLLLRDFFFEHETDARAIIEDQVKFEEALSAIAHQRYHETGEKVRRAVVRSIIYIFLTKMVLALALEAPVDVLIMKRVDYLPLVINAIFPPLLLFLITAFIAIPGADNTKRLLDRIKLIIYQFTEYQKGQDAFTLAVARKRPLLAGIFSFVYMVGFMISFGLIIFILTNLHFNIASQIIFVFFVALVTLFAYRIRQSAKEYEMIERQGILEPIIDFFFLPILYAGDFLSKEIAKINIFIFIFDFILEAPLKVIFEVIEEWIRFIRTKKEEII